MPPTRRYLMVVLSLFVASAAAALNVVLTPEVPVSLPIPGPAPFEQQLAGVASNGADYLAIWLDRRSNVPGGPSFETTAPLYVTRLNTLARPSKASGTKLLDDVLTAKLIGQPSGYIVLWSTTADGVNWMRLDDEGRPVSAPSRLTDGYLTGAVSDGVTILVTHGAFSQAQTASIFTLAGGLVSNTPLEASAVLPLDFGDGRYGVLYELARCNGVTPCTYDEMLTILTLTGASSTTRLRQSASGYTKTAAAVGGDHILIAWMTDSITPPSRTISYQVFNTNADPLTAEKIIDTTTALQSISGAYAPSVGWDGHEFLVAYQWPTTADERSGQIRTVRVTSNGFAIDAPPQVLSTVLGRPPLFARSGSGILVGWDTTISPPSDIAVRVAPTFDALNIGLTNIIPQTAALQSQVQVAAIGSSNVAVWREGYTTGAIVASSSIEGRSVVASSFNSDYEMPGIGASKDTYLVAWREQDVTPTSNSAVRILAKRIRANGTVVENDPIFVATDTVGPFPPVANTVAVESDGTNFLVAWITGNGLVNAARVSSTGAVLDSTPINVSGQAIGTASSVRIVYSAGAYVLAWASDTSCKLCAQPVPPGGFTYPIYVARVASNGSIVAKSEQVVTGAHGLRIGLAGNGNGLMLVGNVTLADSAYRIPCVNALPLTAEGKPDGAVQTVDCSTVTPAGWQYFDVDVDVAWDGSSYVVAWTEYRDGHPIAVAERVTSSGTPRENAPFAIVDTTSSSFGPALTAVPDGVLIAYQRIANEEQYGGVSRAFERTLLRTELPSRRRAVR